jgi:hypothetical protein
MASALLGMPPVFRPGATVIVDARGGNIRVSEPLLHLGNVGFVVERVGRGGRAQRVRANLETELRGVDAHQLVDAVRCDRVIELAGAVVADRPKQRTAFVRAVARGLKVVVNEGLGARMPRQMPRLAAFSRTPSDAARLYGRAARP